MLYIYIPSRGPLKRKSCLFANICICLLKISSTSSTIDKCLTALSCYKTNCAKHIAQYQYTYSLSIFELVLFFMESKSLFKTEGDFGFLFSNIFFFPFVLFRKYCEDNIVYNIAYKLSLDLISQVKSVVYN